MVMVMVMVMVRVRVRVRVRAAVRVRVPGRLCLPRILHIHPRGIFAFDFNPADPKPKPRVGRDVGHTRGCR